MSMAKMAGIPITADTGGSDMTIEVRLDDRTRTVSSVMLLTDFVHENEGWSRPHPLEIRTIEYLSGRMDHPCAEAARHIATKHSMYAFHHYAVLLSDGILADSAGTKPIAEARLLMGDPFDDFDHADFGSLLCQFYADSRIQDLWDDTEADWEAVRRDCVDIVRASMLDEFLELLFGKSAYGLTLIPNPLDPPTYGFGPSDGHTAYAIIGPPSIVDDGIMSGRYVRESQMIADMAFHEFAHPLWNSSLMAYPALLDETASVQKTMEYRGYFPESYSTWDIRLSEIVIRAATAHYIAHRDGGLQAQAFLDREKSWYGIDLIDTVYLALAEYLEACKLGKYGGLHEFLPTLSQMIRTPSSS